MCRLAPELALHLLSEAVVIQWRAAPPGMGESSQWASRGCGAGAAEGSVECVRGNEGIVIPSGVAQITRPGWTIAILTVVQPLLLPFRSPFE